MNPVANRRRILAGLAGLVISPALASIASAHEGVGCGATHDIAIGGFAFSPDTLTVKVGDSIRWTNTDLAPHTATAEDGSWDTGKIAEGESMTLEVTPAMATQYHCLFHPNMKAYLVIVAA